MLCMLAARRRSVPEVAGEELGWGSRLYADSASSIGDPGLSMLAMLRWLLRTEGSSA